MLFSHFPHFLSSCILALALWLHQSSAQRLPLLLEGILFARGRRTVTSWFHAAGITYEFRPAYHTVYVVGRHLHSMATTILNRIKIPLLGPRLMVAIDDTPTPRYGPFVEGAGIHHNPTPGPAGEKHVYGHNWVTLDILAHHPQWDTLALPVLADLYIRKNDLDRLPPDRRPAFQTKLEKAADQLKWLASRVGKDFTQICVVVDGAYAKRPFLRAARQLGMVVFSRLRKDAALRSLPKPVGKKGRGRPAIYGKDRISLPKRAGQTRGWQQVECQQYGVKVTKTIKSFLATWAPAEGVIKVVMVKEDDGWIPYFCAAPIEVLEKITPEEILEAMADRGAVEQTYKDVKEVWGAGQQQVRNLYSNEACFNLNLWMYSLVEIWAWDKPEEELVDRSASPWDNQPRRPSHQDKRKALQRDILHREINACLAGQPTEEKIRELAQLLLDLAA